MPKYRIRVQHYTMEKDDKIRGQQEKTKKYGVLMMVAFAAVCVVYATTQKVEAVPSVNSLRLDQTTILKNGALPVSGAAAAIPVNDMEAVKAMETIVKGLDEEVRSIKKTGVIMETDPEAIKKTTMLKEATRTLLKAKYGDHEAYRVKVYLEFQPSIPDFASKGPDGSITIEMAPIDLQPVSVYNFLEIARTWIRGSFHRNAVHVLQVNAVSEAIHKPLPFQEYSEKFPHKKGTTGYAGRPSGPGWYVSIQDNTINHVSYIDKTVHGWMKWIAGHELYSHIAWLGFC
jgi:hypothetical protein